MKLILHDLAKEAFQKQFPKEIQNDIVIGDHGETIHPCIGCFGCWIKTPCRCVIRDRYQNMGSNIGKCTEFIIISRCVYGGFSPFVKNVLDRSISYIHPFFTIRNGEMHHKSRYVRRIKLHVSFYGEELTEGEVETARSLVAANAVNLNASAYSVDFYGDPKEIGGERT